MFRKYQHVERWGNTEVEGIGVGKCWVFPKIDGTNASVWLEDGKIRCGSRRREISELDDNAGFASWVQNDVYIRCFLEDNPQLRLFGEWLVPHSLKLYRKEAWQRFYVFDVVDETGYVPFQQYVWLLEKYRIDYILPMAVIENGTYEQFVGLLQLNTFLMQDGHVGEGIVIKNYERGAPWAKIITSEFKEKNARTFGPTEMKGKALVEQQIAERYVTEALCRKVKAGIEVAESGWSSRYIPRLLHTVFYNVVREETWEFVKQHKMPNVNFKTLQSLVYGRVKQLLPEVF